MVNEELNKKLAEWAGLTDIAVYDAPEYYAEAAFMHFTTPDGKVALSGRFTQSLDACFKWLVPEVYEKYGEVKTRELLEVWGWYVASGAYWGKEALALCIAIEKLIDNKQ